MTFYEDSALLEVSRDVPDMVRAGPDVARAGMEYHRSIFWAMERG